MIHFSDLKSQNHEAISDSKYFLSQGDDSFQRHLKIWQEADVDELSEEDRDYLLTLEEIATKIDSQTNI